MKTGKFVKILPLFLIILSGCCGAKIKQDASRIDCSEQEGVKLEVYLLKGELVGVREESGRLARERDDLGRRIEKYLSLRCWCKHKGVLIGGEKP